MNHSVRQGETLSSIAERHGLTWEKVWTHPQNAELKKKRKDPHILYPGDVVFLPDKERREEQAATGKRHRFKTKTKMIKFRLRLQEDGEPRTGVAYTLDVEGRTFQGRTDNNGQLEHQIPAGAQRATLVTSEDSFVVKIGHLDPIGEDSGVEQRLRNLGYLGSGSTGQGGEGRESALRAFQEKEGLEATGTLDAATRQKLEQVHGC